MTATPYPPAPTQQESALAAKLSALQYASAYCAVLLCGLFAGFLITVLVLECSMRREDSAVYTQVRIIELHLDDLATALLIPALLAVSVLAVTSYRRRTDRWRLPLIALFFLVVTLIISVTISVPINTMQHGWVVTAPPAKWADIRDRWQLAHAIRTSAALLAFLVLVAVRPSRRRRTPHPK